MNKTLIKTTSILIILLMMISASIQAQTTMLDDPLLEKMPSHLSLTEKAHVYVKRLDKRLELTNVQMLKIEVRRIEYLKKSKEENISNFEQNHLKNKFLYAVIQILNPEQRKKVYSHKSKTT